MCIRLWYALEIQRGHKPHILRQDDPLKLRYYEPEIKTENGPEELEFYMPAKTPHAEVNVYFDFAQYLILFYF